MLGFAEVRLDGVPVGEIRTNYDQVLTIPTVTAGHHVVEVELLDNADGGRPFVPPIVDSVAFTAE